MKCISCFREKKIDYLNNLRNGCKYNLNEIFYFKSQGYLEVAISFKN